MRFAISLLSVLAIASVIGTVLRQSESYSNYIVEFGQFWFSVFGLLGLYDVYHSAWFLVILAFLVLSTSFCIYRNTPVMLREMRSFREHAAESSLRRFAHQAEFGLGADPGQVVQRLSGYLGARGYHYRLNSRGEGPHAGTLVSAKAGSYHRLGYILTHAAIVIICVGGLIDGNVPLKVQELLGYKKIEKRDIPQSQVPPESRLSPSNPAFRGSITIPERTSVDVIFLNVADGYLVQELPFMIKLKKFHIEHYPSGQPKSFASDVVITDKESKRSFERTISVNHPLSYRGVSIYQASFGDGGTRFNLNGWSLFSSATKPFSMQGGVRQNIEIGNKAAVYTIEFGDFRKMNVQNFAESAPVAEGSRQSLADRFKFGNKPLDRDLRNVGPSFQYKVRDAQGQAREYENYMLPLEFEKRRFFLSGVRGAPNEPFHYIRFPVDEQDSLDGFMQLRAILIDKPAYPEIARRFAHAALQGEAVSETLRARLADSTVKVLEIFGGGGFEALERFIEKNVPEAEREKVAQTYLKILESAVFEAYQLSRERAGKAPAKSDAVTMQFVRDSMNGVSDLFAYGAPVYLQLAGFEEVQASGLQLTRSPGKNIVYGGSVLLILGVFVMFYVRERRIWLLVKPQAGTVLFAMSSNRKTLDFEREFNQRKQELADLLKGT